ncbi:MAG TPA: hypothetical protein VFA09_11930 [Ktedonobacteraceae bacterium]|jgi:hypothetical protein|nr:hypothetical protein [Ktedonobacteraceae bacterium]
MVLPAFANFFVASASAGAALVGLLFVAISIAPEHTVMVGAPLERQAVATNAFASLLNAFFISLGALIPFSNLGWVTVIMSLMGVSGSLSMGWNLLRHRRRWQNVLRNMLLLAGSFIVYGYEFYFGVNLIKQPRDVGSLIALTELMLIVYALGLFRAWELLGARRFGLLSWLSPLRTLDEESATHSSDQQPSQADALKQGS